MSIRLWLGPVMLDLPLAESEANPVIVFLLFVLRCLVPLAIMLGLSYLLRKHGWIREPIPPSGAEDQPASPGQGAGRDA